MLLAWVEECTLWIPPCPCPKPEDISHGFLDGYEPLPRGGHLDSDFYEAPVVVQASAKDQMRPRSVEKISRMDPGLLIALSLFVCVHEVGGQPVGLRIKHPAQVLILG